jgi:hypothetical protein
MNEEDMAREIIVREGLARKRYRKGTLSRPPSAAAAPIGANRERPSTESVPVRLIKPNPDNLRTHSAKQIRQIANSIVTFGFKPLEIGKGRVLREGTKVARRPGATQGRISRRQQRGG